MQTIHDIVYVLGKLYSRRAADQQQFAPNAPLIWPGELLNVLCVLYIYIYICSTAAPPTNVKVVHCVCLCLSLGIYICAVTYGKPTMCARSTTTILYFVRARNGWILQRGAARVHTYRAYTLARALVWHVFGGRWVSMTCS